ncbi:MAG: transporter substrate-binding domain-containing protein [Anaerolineaceae bacterium]|nr:transporter substrate-binding domain-containing protein [Anaerolineaceae bacterium]
MKRITLYLTFLFIIMLLSLTACNFRLPEFIQNILVIGSDTPPPADDTVILHVVTDATWPPFESLDPQSGEIVGFDIDVMNAIAEKAGVEVVYKNLPWAKLVESMNTCQDDIYISAMPVRQVPEGKSYCFQVYYSTSFNTMEYLYTSCGKREVPLTFTQSYFQDSGIVMLVNANNGTITSPDDLKDKKVAALIGTSADDFLSDLGAESLVFDNPDLVVQVLLDNKVDALVMDYRTALEYIVEYEGLLKVTGEPLTELSYAIAVCEYGDEKPLLDKINAALDTLRADGTLAELEEKWMK